MEAINFDSYCAGIAIPIADAAKYTAEQFVPKELSSDEYERWTTCF